ncbi:Sporulation and spore germination [Desulfotomaculum arcticum]|uniref:Sporulation and spore germination n=1 Tax=Desulfotruncus arcticus DSM 17038 TaxID=1121424 RepID=A0A1I2Q764_9FIRM|nr:Sporulation and spore germination [Desulfotomaculum arcticum] [Desulfotruncus arcticus DSM 17038]
MNYLFIKDLLQYARKEIFTLCMEKIPVKWYTVIYFLLINISILSIYKGSEVLRLRYKVLFLLILSLVIAVAGCSTREPSVVESEQPGNANAEQKQQDVNLALYFVKFTADDAYLVREVRSIPYTKDVATTAMTELIKDSKSIFAPGTEVLGITIENGLATVNFNDQVLAANVGAAGEELGIQSIVNTLTELPNIEKVAFQVDGKTEGRAMDWWGHVGLYEQPFSRDLSKVYEPTIWVTHPTPNQVASVPLLIKGSARVFEGTVSARLLDEKGNVLAESSATATAGAPERGNFEMSIKFAPPAEGHGVLEVYWASPKDGSMLDTVSIPLQWP